MSGALLLDAKLDTSAAKALVEQLIERRGTNVTLDASETRQIGALCAQALLAASAEWANSGHQLELISVSEHLEKQFDLIGIDHQTLTTKETA